MTNNSIIVRGKNDGIIIKSESIGSNIKRLRQILKKTQKALAKETLIDLRRIRNIENNGLTPTIDEMKKICEVLQVSVLALFFKERINEINCDCKTGLNANAIRWLTKLNHENHSFIKMLNFLSIKQELFKVVYDVIKPIIRNWKNTV